MAAAKRRRERQSVGRVSRQRKGTVFVNFRFFLPTVSSKSNTLIILSLLVVFFAAGIALESGAQEAEERVGRKKIARQEIKKSKNVKKKKKSGPRQPAIPRSIEKRKVLLKTTLQKAGISAPVIEALFADKRLEIYHGIYETPPAKDGEQKKKLSYFDEEFGLLKPESIVAGKKALSDHQELFKNIESVYGIPARYVVAIVRVETNFKEHLGTYSVFNALYTMSMLSKRAKRVRMANRELAAWVKICMQKEIDPFAIKGSWAGAFGIPQFMPSSYLLFAVDNNGDGQTDLYDYRDAFASIANYLNHAGWKTGDEKKMRRAVYRYNHEIAYVNAVFAYAEAI